MAFIPPTNAKLLAPTEVSHRNLLESATAPEHSPPRGIYQFCPPFPVLGLWLAVGQLGLSLCDSCHEQQCHGLLPWAALLCHTHWRCGSCWSTRTLD